MGFSSDLEMTAKLVEALREIALIECQCDVAYTARGRHETNAFHAEYEEELEVIRNWLAKFAPIEWKQE